MRLFKAFLIAAAASFAAPLAAQEANDAAVAENATTTAPAAPDANAVDANALDANLVVAPVDDTVVAEETLAAEETPAPADRDGGGFPWGVLGLLGLLGLIPRLRR